jgi:hypothetical protein
MIPLRFDRKYDSSGFSRVMLCTYYAFHGFAGELKKRTVREYVHVFSK